MMDQPMYDSLPEPYLPIRTTLTEGAILPKQATSGSAGYDLSALEALTLEYGSVAVVRTGVAVGVPLGHVGLVCTRSGLAAKHGIQVVNAPGVIDSDYRGELKVILTKLTPGSFEIRSGDRIAQLLILPAPTTRLEVVETLGETNRGAGGLGSTGV